MFCVTLKVLLFRYAYVMRQRWFLTISYLFFPLILCFLAVWSYDSEELVKYDSRIQEHDERSLLRIPEKKNCLISAGHPGQKGCQLNIVVCPGGAKERQLMDQVVRMLRFSDNATVLNITYVDHSDYMTAILVRSNLNNSRGLHFHALTSTKLEYTIRPRAQYVPQILYDWSDYATTRKFPSPMLRGPRLTDPYFNIDNKMLTLAGFLPLQVAVDKAYIESYFPNVSKEWILTSFPYPPYHETKEEYRILLSHRFYLIFVQYMLIIGIAFMVLVFGSYTINDKRSGIREWLCLNGAIRWMVNISWLVSFCLEATILAICEMGILKLPTVNGPTINYMSASVLTFVLIIYNCMSLCWVYLLASILKSQILCISIVTAYWMFSPLLQWIPPDCFVKQGVLATLPNAGMVLIFKSFQEFDGAETLLDIHHLSTYPIHYLPVGTLLLIMFATTILLILLSFYVDLVRPGPYGRAKPWYLFSRKEEMHSHRGVHEGSPIERRYFEENSSKDPIGLECSRIFKFFRKRKIPCWHYTTAVKDVNMKILKNKITVLLGLNGAGKTTLLSILCGMYSPSIGHFYTEEYDVFQGDNIKKFRKALGYCPQTNLLMSELTVKQHLIIFGLLKGLSRNEAEESSKKWTRRFEMKNFENTKANKLSGGTMRKLCLAIAMTGDPQYLLMDEPSSGLDVESLRTFWNIMLQQKGKCTVVLTTHNMDEAEILGDRIALMVDGQLMAYGSSSFLKEKFETSHKLNCTLVEKDRTKLWKFVENFDNSITILYETHNSVTLGFPVGKSKVIPNLLKSLESEFGDGITTSLSSVTMDDVLMKFFQLGPKNSQNYVEGLEIEENDINRSSNIGQFKAIFGKKMIWICNQSLMTVIILLLILPIIGVILTMHFTNRAIGLKSSSELHTADLKLTLDEYGGTTAFISRRIGNNITSILRRAMNISGITYTEVFDDMVDYLNGLAKKDLFEYRSKMVFAFDGGEKASDSCTAYYSRNAFHSAPIAYSALMNAILLGKATVTTHNFPYVKEHGGPNCLSVPTIVALLFKIILGPILLITSSYFVIFPHLGRRTLFKHLQLMTGLLPWVYWISHLVFDMLIFSVSCLLVIIILVAMDIGLFSNATVMLAFIIVLLMYGISAIIFAYACSFCRCSTSIVVILCVSIPPLLLLIHTILTEVLLAPFSTNLYIEYLYFLPWVILMESLQKVAMWAEVRRACSQCKSVQACTFISTHSLNHWLKPELVGFVITSLLYFTFILAMDHGFGRRLKPIVDRMFYGDIDDNQDDINPDVANEKRRVRYLEMDEEEYQPELMCDGLGKKYSYNSTAVRGVTFAHERGHLLGLLGTNGAGKSTLLGMLSGVISPTKGSATVRGKWELGDCEYKYIKNIGYCPQFDGILPGLSGRSTLELFGCLRGLNPSKLLIFHVERWLQALNMMHLADQPCDQYSAGNKRKLIFAIAMIGFPSVVLLDEPTAGIDPIVRRRIWNILDLGLMRYNQAVVLTSHTMSECEAICDRLAVMTNGEMKSIGSVPKLKNTFGKSCILHVKLQENTTPKQLEKILQNIFKESRFARYAKLQEKRTNMLTINVKTEKMKTYDVFADMLKIKDEHSAIEDFDLTETPLEDAFMMFAQQK